MRKRLMKSPDAEPARLTARLGGDISGRYLESHHIGEYASLLAAVISRTWQTPADDAFAELLNAIDRVDR